jgi:hypothetical protein
MKEQLPPLSPPQRLAIATARFDRARARKLTLEEWKAMYRRRPPPMGPDLYLTCHSLVLNPQRIEGRNAWDIYHALQRLLAETPWPKFTAKEVAQLVDQLVENGVPLAGAREQTAKFLKKTTEAVKQSHIRFGRMKRDKSQ